MAFDYQAFVDSCVKHTGQFDAGDCGVRQEIVRGAKWRIIGVHHLDQSENNNHNNCFVCIVDEHGKRAPNATFRWTWEGRSEPPFTVACDKQPSEPHGNFPIQINMTCSVWVEDDNSDAVHKIHTRLPDQLPGNHTGHHSFLLVFQRYTGSEPTPEPTPTPTPTPADDMRWGTVAKALRELGEELEERLSAIAELMDSEQ